MNWWALSMLLPAGLFAGGVALIACERIPSWRQAELSDFRIDFAETLRRVDKLQPVLLLAGLASTIGFAVTAGGSARMASIGAAAALVIVFVGSGTWLVPIQRRLVASDTGLPASELERLRTRWIRGHLVRTAIGIAAFALVAIAASL